MTAAPTISADPGAVTRKPRRVRFAGWHRMPTKAKAGAIILGFFVLVGIFGPLLAPYAPSLQNPALSASLQGPSGAHWLGTTQSGQDVLSQVLTGIRLTLEVGFLVGVISTVLSVIIGVAAAYLGGFWDELISLVCNVFLVIPALPLLVILLGYLSSKGQWPTIIVLSFLGWAWGARVIRAQSLAIRNRDFVSSAREVGERTWRIIVFEIIPNQVSLIAASFVGSVLYAIGASVALSFIGVASLNTWSLGTILYWAQNGNALQVGAWWWFVPPGVVVAIIGTALVMLNSGVDELGNPRLRDAHNASKAAGHWIKPADPTAVVTGFAPPAGGLSRFTRSFSRQSALEGAKGGRN